MDYRIYHALNQFVYHHAWLGRALNQVETWAVPIIVVATFALWLWRGPAVRSNGSSQPPPRSPRPASAY